MLTVVTNIQIVFCIESQIEEILLPIFMISYKEVP